MLWLAWSSRIPRIDTYYFTSYFIQLQSCISFEVFKRVFYVKMRMGIEIARKKTQVKNPKVNGFTGFFQTQKLDQFITQITSKSFHRFYILRLRVFGL